MAKSQKSSSSSGGKKTGSQRTGRISDRFAEINNEGRTFPTNDIPSDDRRGGSFTEGWNRPTQGARSTGYRSFDEDDSGAEVYGPQSGSRLTRASRGPAREHSNPDRHDERDFRNNEQSSSRRARGRSNRDQESGRNRSESEHYGDQSYGSYGTGAYGSRSSANRGENFAPRSRNERKEIPDDHYGPGTVGGRWGSSSSAGYEGAENFGSSGRGQGYDISEEDEDFQLKSRSRNKRRHFENDEDQENHNDQFSSRDSEREHDQMPRGDRGRPYGRGR